MKNLVMAKVLVVRKSDRTIHIVPVEQEAFYKSVNNKLKGNDKMGLEVMEEEEAKKLPFYDKNYKGASDANAALREKDNTIAELQAKLAALEGKGDFKVVNEGLEEVETSSETAVEKIARINAATSFEKVIEILGDDQRKTVRDAADKKVLSFQQ